MGQEQRLRVGTLYLLDLDPGVPHVELGHVAVRAAAAEADPDTVSRGQLQAHGHGVRVGAVVECSRRFDRDFREEQNPAVRC